MSVKWEGIIEKYQSEKQRGLEGRGRSLTPGLCSFFRSRPPLPLSALLEDRPLPSLPLNLQPPRALSNSTQEKESPVPAAPTGRETGDSSNWDFMVTRAPPRVPNHGWAEDLQEEQAFRARETTRVYEAPKRWPGSSCFL